MKASKKAPSAGLPGFSAAASAMILLALLTLPAAFSLLHPHACLADSLWNDGAVSLYSDHKARAVGDVLTVLIVERAVASNKAQTTSGNDAGLSFAQGTGLLSFLPEAGLGMSSDFRGGKSTTRSGNLVAKMTARVIEAVPGGCLRIQGTQSLVINNEKQNIVITGIVRPQDIHSDNTVLSTYIADAEIKYEGAPEAVQRRGIIGFLQRFFTGLINIIF